MKRAALLVCSILLFGGPMNASAGEKVINIAHRGASAYLPEHTLPAKALAYHMEADFIEQDVVLTKDNVPLVIHDIHLDTVTDVATRFPERKREDGRFYAIDFTFAEIKSLKVNERIDLKSGKAVFPGRFPLGKSEFRLASLNEEIEMIQGLNRSTGRNIGIYPEIKEPAWHRNEGRDITAVVLKTLADYGYKSAADNVFLQCFDFAELKRIRNELGCQLPLIQLVEDEDNFDIGEVASYADGIGPSLKRIVTGVDANGGLIVSDFVEQSHRVGLKVHPWTFRADSLPPGVSGEALLTALIEKAGVDGLFSDFPDISGRKVRLFNLKNRDQN